VTAIEEGVAGAVDTGRLADDSGLVSPPDANGTLENESVSWRA
jgi:hypothetical protein